MKVELVTGDDNIVDVQLKRNNRAVVVPPTATVRAAVVDEETELVYGPVTCDKDFSGANWGSGIVVINFPAALSDTFPVGKVTIEIEVDDGRLNTYFLRHCQIVKARIE